MRYCEWGVLPPFFLLSVFTTRVFCLMYLHPGGVCPGSVCLLDFGGGLVILRIDFLIFVVLGMKIFQKVSYDPDADACYIAVSSSKVHDTIQKSDDCFVDMDKDGQVVGIEILHVAKHKSLLDRILISNIPVEQCV